MQQSITSHRGYACVTTLCNYCISKRLSSLHDSDLWSHIYIIYKNKTDINILESNDNIFDLIWTS